MVGLFALFVVAGAFAANGYSLFGGAEHETNPGNGSLRAVKLVSDLSDADPDNDYSGVDFDLMSALTFADVETLGTDYNVTDDDCMGGSPRFQVGLDSDGDGDTDGNVFVYIGPAPNFTGCPTGWQSTGDLTDSTDARFDLTQFGGAFYATYSDAVALVGSYDVTGIQLVADAGWAFADQEQTVLVDNVMVNDAVYTFEPSQEECKKGGWQAFGMFKNQGDCVSYFATQGSNAPAQ